jgi:hypothetical protein
MGPTIARRPAGAQIKIILAFSYANKFTGTKFDTNLKLVSENSKNIKRLWFCDWNSGGDDDAKFKSCIVKGGLNLSMYEKKYRPLGCWKSQLSMNNPILIQMFLVLLLFLKMQYKGSLFIES